MTGVPYIPRYITVHLGRPDAYAQNVTVTFPDYIKNVASSEIYPTWPSNSLRANIYVQVTFALNRIYTEWYRSRGYDFDITNSTQFDQKYIHGRDIFQSVSTIVDELFNDYIRRQGFIEPLFAQFCNGTTVTCNGLSQWGTVDLARQGYTPYEMLQYYYGSNIDIVFNAPVDLITGSYPGTPLRRGSTGNQVRTLQVRLNRVSSNYPAIPKIYPVDGIFGPKTESAVKAFQRVFGLTQDGIVGKATWYKLSYLYVSVKRLAELDSEGITLGELSKQYPDAIKEGDTGEKVKVLQFLLGMVANFNEEVPPINVDGIFGKKTKQAVIAFQKGYGLPPDGIVGNRTWDELWRAYQGILDVLPANYLGKGPATYPGTPLRQGSSGEAVVELQTYLSFLSGAFPAIPQIPVTGTFGEETKNAVRIFQSMMGMTVDGVVGPETWDAIASLYEDVRMGQVKQQGQFPGYELTERPDE